MLWFIWDVVNNVKIVVLSSLVKRAKLTALVTQIQISFSPKHKVVTLLTPWPQDRSACVISLKYLK